MSTVALKGGALIDGTGAPLIPDSVIIIEGDRIRQIGARGLTGAPDATVIDLTGKTILPGLIDTHVHIGTPPGAPPGGAQPSETDAAVAAANNARAALLAGVTTLRDVGSLYSVGIKIGRLIAAGTTLGPRILSCGQALCMTGGHGFGFSCEVDGPDEARKAARAMLKAGAQAIKLMASGNNPNVLELTEEEMRAAVDVAHDAGVKVACHASGWGVVPRALAAGVDSIEHGYTLNEALVETMLRQGTFLVPTLATFQRVVRTGDQYEYWRSVLPALKRRLETVCMPSLQLAYRSGVKIALGTDASQPPLLRVGELALEFQALQDIGLSPMEAIRASTAVAAECIGREATLGTIEAGKLADITVLSHNPLADSRALTDVFMVIKDGVVVVANGVVL